MAEVAVAALLIAVTAVLGLFLFQRRLIYFPSSSIAAPAETLNAEPIAIRSADGTLLSGWFMSPPDGDAKCTTVVFNGNGGNRHQPVDHSPGQHQHSHIDPDNISNRQQGRTQV